MFFPSTAISHPAIVVVATRKPHSSEFTQPVIIINVGNLILNEQENQKTQEKNNNNKNEEALLAHHLA